MRYATPATTSPVCSCGCWRDEPQQHYCRECSGRDGERSGREVPWPCPTRQALDEHEGKWTTSP